jgi:nitrogen fixation protein FixH
MPVELATRTGTDGVRTDTFTLQGWHVLVLFVAFFGVVFAVNATMMSYALRTMPGLDARNGYDPSQRWNSEIRAMAAQDALGWRAVTHAGLIGGRAMVSLQIADRDGRPVDHLGVEARLNHPSDRKRDILLALDRAGGGRYVGTAGAGTAGAWDLVIKARGEEGGEPVWRSRQRVMLKD